MLTGTIVPFAKSDVVIRRESEGVLLFQVRTDEMHFVHQDAFAVFQMCDGTRTIGEIHSQLVASQPDLATSAAEGRIHQFIEELVKRDLVELWA